jgi:hypothetical protein
VPKYLTVSQFKRAGMGNDLSSVSVPTLTMTIAQAEAGIDAHMGFDPKVGGFEPHDTWIQERWNSKTLRTRLPSHPIPVRNIQRYRIQVSNLSGTGAGFFANIASSDCVINEYDSYVEIVPLQAVTYSLSPVILQLGLNPPIVQLDCEVGYYLPILGEQLIDSGNHQLYYGIRGFWASSYDQALHVQPNTLPPVPPVVYVNGVVASSSIYSINYTEGSVLFTSVQSSNPVVTADYTMQIPDYVYFSAIEQTSYLLAERALTAQGMKNVGMVRSGDIQVTRNVQRGVPPPGVAVAESEVISPLCKEARGWLNHMAEIGIA